MFGAYWLLRLVWLPEIRIPCLSENVTLLGDYKPEPNVNVQRERKTGIIFSSCDLHLEFPPTFSERTFTCHHFVPSLQGGIMWVFCFSFFSDKLLHLQLNSVVYLWSGQKPFLLFPSRPWGGFWVSALWTLNSFLIDPCSFLSRHTPSAHRLCCWLCSVGLCSSRVSLWQRAWSVQHSSFSVFSLWLQPLEHKYSPAGSQTRAEMKNPEAQQDVSVSQGIRMMFYVMKPSETSFQTLEEVPDYVQKVRLSGKRLLLLSS